MYNVQDVKDVIAKGAQKTLLRRACNERTVALSKLHGSVVPFSLEEFMDGMWAVDAGGRVYEYNYTRTPVENSPNIVVNRVLLPHTINVWTRGVNSLVYLRDGRRFSYRADYTDLLILVDRNLVTLPS